MDSSVFLLPGTDLAEHTLWRAALEAAAEGSAKSPENNSQTSWSEGWLGCLCSALPWKEGSGPAESNDFIVGTRAGQNRAKNSNYPSSSWAGVVETRNNEDILVAEKLSFSLLPTRGSG